MSKLAKIILTLFLSMTILSGCFSSESKSSSGQSFEIVLQEDLITVYRDIKTDVLYMVHEDKYDGSGISVMLDWNGKPLLYENWR